MGKSLDVVELAARMMEIDSTSGREGELVDWLESHLAGLNWSVRRIPVTAGRDDLLASSGGKARVTLSTHLDTVPPYIPPRLDRDTLWGRGACDAKGIAAAMILAAGQLRARGVPVALLFVVGEEVSHDGAEAANQVPTSNAILINGEPTEGTLASGTKGAMRFTITTRGQAAHSAYPHLGRSALTELVRLLAEMETLELPRDDRLGDTTINIGVVSGGVADNVLAPDAEARLMARLVTAPEVMETILRRWIGARAELEIGITVPPVVPRHAARIQDVRCRVRHGHPQAQQLGDAISVRSRVHSSCPPRRRARPGRGAARGRGRVRRDCRQRAGSRGARRRLTRPDWKASRARRIRRRREPWTSPRVRRPRVLRTAAA